MWLQECTRGAGLGLRAIVLVLGVNETLASGHEFVLATKFLAASLACFCHLESCPK